MNYFYRESVAEKQEAQQRQIDYLLMIVRELAERQRVNSEQISHLIVQLEVRK